MRPPDAIVGWDDQLNAELYDRFTRDYPFYTDTSRDLADRADLAGKHLLVDLCGGTGITSAVLLETLPVTGRIISIDAARAMQTIGRRTHSDPRINWIVARAEEATQHVGEPVDAVVCNSAIWKTDTTAVFAAIKQILKPGSRFVFNIGGAFAGIPPRRDPRSGPSLNDLITDIAAADHGYRPPPDPRSGTALTPEAVEAQLGAAGFTLLAIDTVTRTGTMAEKRAWLTIPAFARPQGPFTYTQRMEILERAYANVDKSQPVTTAWLVVTAQA